MQSLTPENTSRKVDNLGRVVIPKGIRDRFSIHKDDELQFFSLEFDGNYYVCMTNGRTVDPKYRAAADVLEELGLSVPPELSDMY